MKKGYIIIIIIVIICAIVSIVNLLKPNNNNEIQQSQQVIENNQTTDIITSFYPVYLIALNLVEGAENVKLTNLTSNDVGCLHHYQLTTDDMKTLHDSDIFIVNGAGMESFLDKAVSSNSKLKIVDSSNGVNLIGENSHTWLSFSNHIKQTENIKQKLIELNPKNADTYEKNAKNYIEKLKSEKTKVDYALKDIVNKDVVIFNEAFEYLAEDFKLNVVEVIEQEEHGTPSAGELTEIIDKIKSSNVNVILVENNYSASIVEAIKTETNVKVYEINPILSGDLNDKEVYIKSMQNNLQVLQEALK